MHDLISRQAAIDGVKTLHDVAWKNWHEPTLSANAVLDMIMELPSAQVESSNDAEFWRNRAKEYEKMVGELIADMSRGVKFESMEINAEGLVFKMKEPYVQVNQYDKTCKTCKYEGRSWHDEPCEDCRGNMWEAKDGKNL